METGARARYDLQSVTLSESKLHLAFALATICLCRSVRSARDVIACVKRTGGPFAQAVIRARRSQKLSHAKNHQHAEKKMLECSEHDALPRRKRPQRTILKTAPAISLSFRQNGER